MAFLPIGADPSHPQYATLEVGPASRIYHEAMAETQIHSGPGILHSICNTQLQDVDIWDHDGASPANGDLLVSLKLQPSKFEILDLRFATGLRIQTPTGKAIILHYCPT